MHTRVSVIAALNLASLTLATLTLGACAAGSAPDAPAPAANVSPAPASPALASEDTPDPALVSAAPPELYDATPDGGRVSNADGEFAEQAGEIANAHCLKTMRNVRIVGITADRHSLIFTCQAG